MVLVDVCRVAGIRGIRVELGPGHKAVDLTIAEVATEILRGLLRGPVSNVLGRERPALQGFELRAATARSNQAKDSFVGHFSIVDQACDAVCYGELV